MWLKPNNKNMDMLSSLSQKSAFLIEKEDKYGAHNYHPLPVVLERGEGVYVYDVDGKEYIDFLSAYSAVNQGHCHPRIIQALVTQAQKLTLTSRAFHNNLLGECEEFMSNMFGYDKVLMMNSGVEAVETAIKLVRKWGYQVKGIPSNEAVIVFARDNFHGRTTTVISASNDMTATQDFGPFMPGIVSIPYNDIEALESLLNTQPNIAGFIVEPIQGEAGANVPDADYLTSAAQLCKAKNVLYVADEIQTGIARSGGMLATCPECSCQKGRCRQPKESKPDILILGKALSGGVMPVSAVLADDEVMMVLKPGEHGSTFGGNPLACAVAMEALKVVVDEDLATKSKSMGQLLRKGLNEIAQRNPIITLVRGRGLLNAIVIDDSGHTDLAWDICMEMKDHGLLAKPTHTNKIRLAPPLVITKEQIQKSLRIIEDVLEKFRKI